MDPILLQNIGLNKNEALIYVELAKLGETTAGNLIKTTILHRNIVYDNLEKLIEKGLVSFVLKGKIKLFLLAPPDMLDDFIEKQQNEINKKKEQAIILKQEIVKYFETAKQQQISVIYRGINGVKIVIKDLLETSTEFISFGAPKKSNEIMGEHYWKNFSRKQAEKNIKAKTLFNESLRYRGKEMDTTYNQVKYLQNAIEPLTQTIVWGNKTAIIVWIEKPIITLINSEEVSSSYKHFFNLLWRTAKK